MNDNANIPDEEINVEKIMHTIRDNVRKQKCDNNLTKIQQDTRIFPSPRGITGDIRNNTYAITSHRKFFGKFLVKCRKIVNGEVRRYIDPVVWNQISFNEKMVTLCSDYENKISNLEQSLAQLSADQFEREIAIHEALLKIKEQEQQILSQMEIIRLQRESNCKKMRDATRKMKVELLNSLPDIRQNLKDRTNSIHDMPSMNALEFSEPTKFNYLTFEEKFRGSQKEIKDRQCRYIQFFENCTNVLDIGCGRGEFLELLKEHKITGVGIDINKDMVELCRSKELKAIQRDAIVYLHLSEDNAIDGIFSDQVIEHLTPDYLIKLLEQAYCKLKPGSFIVLGTVNILNPEGLANFFVDPTHISPIHPTYLKYCLETIGFQDIRIFFRTYDDRENDLPPDNLKQIAADYMIAGKK